MRGIILLSLLLVLLLGNPVIAEQSIEDIVRQGVSQAQGSASSEDSGKSVPNYSKEKATEEGEKLSNIDDGELKSKANEKMLSAEADTAEGITRDAMNKKPLDGFEKHEMFKKADEIWKDPLSEMEKITAKDCKERVNEQKNQYTKKTTKEKQYDTELYEESCEKPVEGVTCEKTLDLICIEKKEGGFENIVGDVTLEHEDDVLKIKIENLSKRASWKKCTKRRLWKSCTHYDYDCGTHDRLIQFSLSNLDQLSQFILHRVEFSSHLWIKVNDTTVYISGIQARSIGEEGNTVLVASDNNYNDSCEKSTHFSNDLNIDLKPYLKDGQNTIWMRVIVGHKGGHARLTINQKKSCINWKETWEKRCWQN